MTVLELNSGHLTMIVLNMVMEWAERAAALLPRDRWDVRLGFVDEPLLRRVQACPYGDAPELPARAPRTLA